MSIKIRVRKLQVAVKIRARRNRPAEALEAERLAFRQRCIEAGVRPVDESFHLKEEEWIQYCRFFGFDPDREQYDMPCDSWRFRIPVDRMTQVVYWYNKLERGELTREEYHRLVLEFGGLQPEGSSSGG